MGAAFRYDARVNSSSVKNLNAKFQVWEAKMKAETRQAAREAGEELKDLMQAKIRSEDRIRTWLMHDSVEVKRSGNSGWGSSEAGWFDGEPYFVYQEMGFNYVHSTPNKWIEGMFAFFDAYEIATANLTAKLHRIVN